MAKLIIPAAALTLLITLTVASTITMVDQENPGECRQQPEALPACQRYLRESSRPLSDEREGNDWREEFPNCCNKLDEVERECRCDGVRRTVEAEKQQGKVQGLEMREMLETARSLPLLCRLASPRRCNIEREVA